MLVMLLAAILVLHSPQNGLDRFRAYMAGHPTLAVQIDLSDGSTPKPIQVDFLISRPALVRLVARSGLQDYHFVKNAKEAIEWVNPQRAYQLYPSSNSLLVEEGVLSDLSNNAFPYVLFSGDLRKETRPEAPFKLLKKEAAQETWESRYKNPMGSQVMIAVIAADGRLLRYENHIAGAEGTTNAVYRFHGYNPAPKIDATTFRTEPPVGFTAYALPPLREAFAVGATLTLGRWQTTSGSVDLDPLARGKLLVVVQSRSHPDEAMLKFLAQPLPVETLVLSPADALGPYHDPDPAVGRGLLSIGTPLLILLDRKGTVRWLGLGFDPQTAPGQIEEMKAAAKGMD